MRIELYIVTTENPDLERLKELKVKLCYSFGGLTKPSDFEGYWAKTSDLITDVGEVWVIFTEYGLNGILHGRLGSLHTIFDVAQELRELCKQNTQLVTVNDIPLYVNELTTWKRFKLDLEVKAQRHGFNID